MPLESVENDQKLQEGTHNASCQCWNREEKVYIKDFFVEPIFGGNKGKLNILKSCFNHFIECNYF